jgi:hypothetical protein
MPDSIKIYKEVDVPECGRILGDFSLRIIPAERNEFSVPCLLPRGYFIPTLAGISNIYDPESGRAINELWTFPEYQA